MVETIAIIQARMSSSRLPGKVLLPLGAKTVLERVIDRVKASEVIQHVIVATSIEVDDLPVVEVCVRAKTQVFCGSLQDVLDRFFQTARLFNPQHVVRITADCPLIDPHIIDQVVKAHTEGGYDYSSNSLSRTYPHGLDVEVFTFASLEKTWKEARLNSEREHVTPYMRNHPEIFTHFNLAHSKNLSTHRWTLDHPDDYELINKIYEELMTKKTQFFLADILAVLEDYPQWEKINSHLRQY